MSVPFEVAVFRAIFPTTQGAIPPEKVSIIPRILEHIVELERLVGGNDDKSPRGRDEDKALNHEIAKLKESGEYSWDEIALKVGNNQTVDGVRKRYARHLKRSKVKEESPKNIFHGQEFIEHDHPGEPPVIRREDKPAKPAESSPRPEVVAEVPATKRALKAMGRAELDAKIWELWRAGKEAEEISDILYSEGLYYSANSVRTRLISQGAKPTHKKLGRPKKVSESTADTKNVAERPFFTDKIDEALLQYEFDDLSPDEMAGRLKADGAIMSAEDISARLEELHNAPEASP